MIFATCGTSDFPFNRMMMALSALPAEDLCIQHGPAAPPPCARADAYMPFSDITAQMALADVVVTHAGVGSILSAVRAGHTPIVFPRLKRHGESVDDHQAELADELSQRDTVIVVRTSAELTDAVLSSARPTTRVAPDPTQPLVDAVYASIVGIPLRAVPITSEPAPNDA